MKILLIENEPRIARSRIADLSALGFVVDWIRSLDPLRAGPLEDSDYRSVLLTFGGAWSEQQWEALQWLLSCLRAPVLIIGPREALPWIERALHAGAEDFLLEPVDPQDLAVRIRASARHANNCEEDATRGPRLQLNPVQRTVVRGGRTIQLTACEYIILAILIAEPGRIVPRAQLEQQLYAGAEGEIGSNTVEVYIHNLRRKLGDRLIRTARGRGYWVDPGSGAD